MSLLIDVADSIVAELNLAAFGQQFTAVRRWNPRRSLKSLSALRVDVVPSQPSVETEPADRGVFQNDVSIDIAVRKRADVNDLTTLDALAGLMEEITDYFQGHVLPIPADLITAGRFASGDLSGWQPFYIGDGSSSVVDGKCRLEAGALGSAQISQAISGLLDGTTYTLKFTVSGTHDVKLTVEADSTLVDGVTYSAGRQSVDFVMDGTAISALAFATAGNSQMSEVSDISLIRQGADRIAQLRTTELLAIADAAYQHEKRVFFAAATLTYRVHTDGS